ncbi:MAG: cysteine desulfurase [Planctomycetaceae bacterium]|nr:cysteine desulfurase [Planctomycetaceae bacterium]
MSRIYLDYNATTPLAPKVIAALEPFLRDGFGNPSSLHWAGIPARDAVEQARCQVAALLRCDATELVFTSGGTEANNYALKGAFFSQSLRKDRPHFIITQIEHPAVTEPCRFLECLGAEVTHIRVDGCGRVDPDDVRRAIRPGTVLVSVMHANNEVGTIQPIETLARIAREHEVLMHTDAAQTVGKILVDVESLGVDLLTIAGHKLYAPKGVGALYVREGVELEPLLHGAAHEAGRRGGTENVLEIVGLGAACDLAKQWVDDPGLARLRDHFWQSLKKRFGERVVLNGHPEHRLPNTLNVSFRGLVGSEILARMPEVAASTGSACHAGSIEMSPVLKAMGVSEAVGLGAVRFSLGRESTIAEVECVIEHLSNCLDQVQASK